MTINAAGVQLIESFEGCRLTSYLCPAGKLTIGFGHTGPDVKPGLTISLERARELLQDDLLRFEKGVDALVTVPINENQLAALVSFAYNLGLAALANSTLLRKVNDNAFAEAALEFAKWRNARDPKTGQKVVLPGLVKRRAAEAALFRKPVLGGYSAVA